MWALPWSGLLMFLELLQWWGRGGPRHISIPWGWKEIRSMIQWEPPDSSHWENEITFVLVLETYTEVRGSLALRKLHWCTHSFPLAVCQSVSPFLPFSPLLYPFPDTCSPLQSWRGKQSHTRTKQVLNHSVTSPGPKPLSSNQMWDQSVSKYAVVINTSMPSRILSTHPSPNPNVLRQGLPVHLYLS